MGTLWFCLVSFMIAMYVVLDGYDIGTGIVYFIAGRTDADRRLVLRTIGPVWDGNEVWLLAGGATLYFAFPALYASGFSGFYLPLIIVLWLLIGRGLAIELRNHFDNPVWRPFWDAAFFFSSLLLAIFFGAALANVVRGVPLDANGWFFEPLWTHFGTAGETGILDWYTVLVAIAAVFALGMHGALWVAMKTEGPPNGRSRRAARLAWPVVAVLSAAVTAGTFLVQPQAIANMAAHPWGAVFPLLAAAGLAGCFRWTRKGADARAFLASCVYLLGMLTSAVFGIHPYVLPATTDPAFALTVEKARAPDYGLGIGIVWWSIGMALAAVWIGYTHTRFRGKVRLEEGGY